MKKKLLLLGLGLFSVWATPTVQVAQAASIAPVEKSLSTPDYIWGYTEGSAYARDAKCSFRGSEAGYNDWYFSWREYAAYYRDEASQSGDAQGYEYWSGFYDGMQEGYNLYPFCQGTGGGGGTGPLEPEPYNPN